MAQHFEPAEGAAAAERFSADGVRFARVNHADPHGRCRSKELPIARLAMATHGIGYCAASLVEGLDGEPLMDKDVRAALANAGLDFQHNAEIQTPRIWVNNQADVIEKTPA